MAITSEFKYKEISSKSLISGNIIQELSNANLFISFVGPEASGKSSQIKLLSFFLKKNNIPHLITREPGGTLVGEKLRKIILDKKETITPTEEILLLMSSSLNHINNIK